MKHFFSRALLPGLALLLGLPLAGQAQSPTVTRTSLAPAANATTAPRTTTVAVPFSQPINAATAGTIKLFSPQYRGQRTATASTSGSTVTLTPTVPASGSQVAAFRPGETVFVSVPATVLSTGGTAAVPYVYQFTAAATGGSATFNGTQNASVSTNPQSVAVGDVDGDGDLDMVTANNNAVGTASLRLNNGAGTFSGGTDISVGNNPRGVVLGDVDGDGDLDLLTANYIPTTGTVSIRLNDGAGNFSGSTNVNVGSNPQSVAVGDVDGDGDLDLLTANDGGGASVRFNNGSGTFSGTALVAVGNSPTAVAVGDADGDGDLDLFVASYNSGVVNVRMNDGTGNFSGGSDVSTGSTTTKPTSLALGDVDNDGDLDLIAALYTSSAVVVRVNDGAGNFSGTTSLTVGTNPRGVALADLDGDGDLDMLAANYSSSTVSVRVNNGSGTFSGTGSANVGANPYGLAVGDVDGDLDLDLLTANLSISAVSVRLNQAAVPTLTSLSPTLGAVGNVITLTGTGFIGATGVSFNGTAATTFSVTNSTTATATVPAGATTGNVTITTPAGTSNGVLFTVGVPTATPVLSTPANGSYMTTATPTFTGTAPAGSTVTLYIAGQNTMVTFPATAAGTFSYTLPSQYALPDGTYPFSVTATSAGQAESAQSNTNTFTIDTTAPTVTLDSPTGPLSVANGGSTAVNPAVFTASFSEAVTGFTLSDIVVTNGVVVGFGTSSTPNAYYFNVYPNANGLVTVNIPAGAAQDVAGNGNTAAMQYSFTYTGAVITIAPATLPNGTSGTAYSQTITATGGQAPYRYALTGGTLPTGLALTPSSSTQTASALLSGTPTVAGTYSFTIRATSDSTGSYPLRASRTYMVTIATAPTAVGWNGSVSTDWFTAANWTPAAVPDATIDATIPTAPSGGLFPLIGANGGVGAAAKNVSIATGASLSMSANTLTVAANLTNNGTFNGFTSSSAGTGGTVAVGGTAAATIAGTGTTRFWNLTVGTSTAQLTGGTGASLSRLLTLSGNLTTNGNAFTLVSDANNTAMVVNNGSAVVSGDVTVQRYISPALQATKAYRHASAPISNATIGSLNIAGGFQVEISQAAVYNSSATPGAVRPFPNVFGYDQARLATVVSSYSLFDRGWVAPTAQTDAMTQGKGYTVSTAANQTWSFTGTLGNGAVTQALARNGGPTQTIANGSGLHLVGNPYPAPLDLSQVAAADRLNLDQYIAVWAAGSSGYAYYTNGLGSTGPVVPLGQGFFVRVTPGQTSGSLTLRNAYRAQSFQSPTYYRTTETRPVVRLALQAVGSTETDDAFVYFESGATAAFDSQFDAPKISNPSGLNLSSSLAGSEAMAINGLTPLTTAQVVVPLAVGVPAVGSYTLSAAQLLNLGTTPTYLRDLLTGALVDLAQQPSYQFTVSNASALITGRFELVFSPQQPLATATAALAQQVGLYPNPATGSASVELPAALGRTAVTATLVDAVGREVRSVTLPAQGAVAHPLDLRELPSGVYVLRLYTSAGTLIKKLTVE